MTGLDTNILVRYLMQDDAAQFAAAARLIDGFTPAAPGFVSQVVLVETVWVLTRVYKLKRNVIADTLAALLRARELIYGLP